MRNRWKWRGGRLPPRLTATADQGLTSGIGSESVEIAGFALDAFAFFAFGNVLHFTVLENRLHFNFAAAGAVEVVRAAGRTSVLRYLCHYNLLENTRYNIRLAGTMSTLHKKTAG